MKDLMGEHLKGRQELDICIFAFEIFRNQRISVIH